MFVDDKAFNSVLLVSEHLNSYQLFSLLFLSGYALLIEVASMYDCHEIEELREIVMENLA